MTFTQEIKNMSEIEYELNFEKQSEPEWISMQLSTKPDGSPEAISTAAANSGANVKAPRGFGDKAASGRSTLPCSKPPSWEPRKVWTEDGATLLGVW